MKVDITGNRYGKLVVLSFYERKKVSNKTRSYYLCKCDCGKEKVVNRDNLIHENTKSCGCIPSGGGNKINEKDFLEIKKKELMNNIKIDENLCWNWKKRIGRSGYGEMSFRNGRKIRVHRFSYTIHKGKISKNMFVCHTCDNKICCNPDHLWLGNREDNRKDMMNKGRSSKGIGRPLAKLDDDKVKYCRFMNEKVGIPKMQLANFFNVSPSTMQMALNGKTWRHV